MMDVLIYESGNGGELSLRNGDIETTDSLANQAYLSHFGGNVEASTIGNEIESEQRRDWYGNSLLDVNAQMNSELERALNANELGSLGRSNIERAALKDIQHLSDLADIASTAKITGNNKINITDKIDKTVADIIWDSTKNELIYEITI